ncbi:MAG: hypothetical protein L3J52_00485 [Proteobacteria bacterium]|nr:hypothetical protein [Pseudomonadota bacterium]
MKTKTGLWLIMITLAFLLAGCGGDDSAEKQIAKLDTNTPDGAFNANIIALKNNDIRALILNSVSKEDYDKLVTEFENSKTAGNSDAQKEQFVKTVSMLTADDAEENLYQQIAPQLEMARNMLPMMMMGKDQMLQGIGSSPMVPDDQKDNLTKIASAAMDWVAENDIFSEELTKNAIGVVVRTAKNLNLNTLDEVQNMNFDQALEKGSIVLGGVKSVLNTYGISVDTMLDSVQISDVQVNGDTASMKVGFEIFGELIDQTINMNKKDGKWVSEQ